MRNSPVTAPTIAFSMQTRPAPIAAADDAAAQEPARRRARHAAASP